MLPAVTSVLGGAEPRFTLGMDPLSHKQHLSHPQFSDRYVRRSSKNLSLLRASQGSLLESLPTVDETADPSCEPFSNFIEARERLCQVIVFLNTGQARASQRVAAERSYFDALLALQESGETCPAHCLSRNHHCELKSEVSVEQMIEVLEYDRMEALAEREVLLAQRERKEGLKRVNPKQLENYGAMVIHSDFFGSAKKQIQMFRAWLVAQAVSNEERWVSFLRRVATRHAEAMEKLAEPATPAEPVRAPLQPWRL